MKLVIVVDVEVTDAWAEDPHELAEGILFSRERHEWRFVRASWAKTDADLDDVLDEEEE